jgi:hypothetical protein
MSRVIIDGLDPEDMRKFLSYVKVRQRACSIGSWKRAKVTVVEDGTPNNS